MKQSDDYYTKPSIWCQMIHQSIWVDQDQYGIEGVQKCPHCYVYFDYPTQQKVYPVYKK